MKRIALISIGVFCLAFVASSAAWAYWVQDGAAICTATGDQDNPQIISDGAGGAIITWYDLRSGNADIYAQRVNGSGIPQWVANGVALCTTTGDQVNPQITSDGEGGAIVVWEDYRSGGWVAYAQRVNSSGIVQWAANGVTICTQPGDRYLWEPQIISDGAGGAIITWSDFHSEIDGRIWAQRVNASGAIHWATNGVALCVGIDDQVDPQIVSDGTGGAIVAWVDYRVEHYIGDIYAQRVNASGALQWATDGVALSTATGDQRYPTITSDGAGGAIVAWYDSHNSEHGVIHAQRLNASGAVQWTTDGVALSIQTWSVRRPAITSDGAGGAIVTWSDCRIGYYTDEIYAQRVNASGALQWATDGVAMCAATGIQDYPTITSDGAGGAIVTWQDYRSGTNYNVYTRRVNASGTPLWTPDGVALCTATGDQQYPQIISDGAGGAIVTWYDNRSGNYDIYAQWVDANGVAPAKWPRAPQGLCGTPFYYNNNVIGLFIHWKHNIESNIAHYNIYKDTSEDFIPEPFYLLASQVDTVFFDGQWRWTPFVYYKISAVDSSGNESDFALLRPDDVTGTETSITPEASYLAQNFPNPFNPTTRIGFGLAISAQVSLRIYDAAGRLVREITKGELPAGRYEKVWDGRDAGGSAVASGIYFYKLDAGAFTQTRKLVLLR